MGFLRGDDARFAFVRGGGPCRDGEAPRPGRVPGRDSTARLRPVVDNCELPPALVPGVALGLNCLLLWRGCSGANVPLLAGFCGRFPLARVDGFCSPPLARM